MVMYQVLVQQSVPNKGQGPQKEDAGLNVEGVIEGFRNEHVRQMQD